MCNSRELQVLLACTQREVLHPALSFVVCARSHSGLTNTLCGRALSARRSTTRKSHFTLQRPGDTEHQHYRSTMRETTIENACCEECQATACDAQCQMYKIKQTQRKLCSVSLDALGSTTLFSKTSLGLGPNKEWKQVMLQLAGMVK